MPLTAMSRRERANRLAITAGPDDFESLRLGRESRFYIRDEARERPAERVLGNVKIIEIVTRYVVTLEGQFRMEDEPPEARRMARLERYNWGSEQMPVRGYFYWLLGLAKCPACHELVEDIWQHCARCGQQLIPISV